MPKVAHYLPFLSKIPDSERYKETKCRFYSKKLTQSGMKNVSHWTMQFKKFSMYSWSQIDFEIFISIRFIK